MNADDAMSDLIEYVSGGHISEPRGKRVRERLAAQASFDMRYPLVARPSRNLGYRFAPAEAAWILGGENKVDRISRFSKFVWEFSDDSYFYAGAYGPKVIDQLTYVCDVLADDKDTRQAVIDIWRPNPRTSKDIPCTLSFQFIARHGYLHVIQTMRSSDVWLGYPYDVFNATMLAGYILLLLRHRRKRGRTDLRLGTHTVTAGSAHLYEKDWAKTQEFVGDKRVLFKPDPFDPLDQFDEPDALIDHLWNMAGEVWTSGSMYLVNELREVSRSKAGSNV